jgi:predicted dinucleotide-utilizing enzyme
MSMQGMLEVSVTRQQHLRGLQGTKPTAGSHQIPLLSGAACGLDVLSGCCLGVVAKNKDTVDHSHRIAS